MTSLAQQTCQMVRAFDSREHIWNLVCWDRCDDLVPEKSADAEQETPRPLIQSEGRGKEDVSAKLNDEHLQQSAS